MKEQNLNEENFVKEELNNEREDFKELNKEREDWKEESNKEENASREDSNKEENYSKEESEKDENILLSPHSVKIMEEKDEINNSSLKKSSNKIDRKMKSNKESASLARRHLVPKNKHFSVTNYSIRNFHEEKVKEVNPSPTSGWGIIDENIEETTQEGEIS